MPTNIRTFAIIPLFVVASLALPRIASAQGTETKESAPDISHLQAQAAGGDAKAQLKLAEAYEKGDGVPQDPHTAFDWCRKAADQGDAVAENRLGEMYRGGEGVTQDKAAAVQWYCKAARQGNAEAMCNLGVAFYNGDGVDVNDGLSYAWFLLAKDAGCSRAAEAVQRAESEISPMKMTVAYGEIAKLYDAGRCLGPNPKDEVRWLIRAAERGDEDAQASLALAYLDGKGVPQDIAEGQRWCNEFSKKHEAFGDYCKGYMYEKGLGFPKNEVQARKSYERAVNGRNVKATRALAVMETQGRGGKVDMVSASLLYAWLAKHGDKQALYDLAALKKQMDPKDWGKVKKQLPSMGIDAGKLDVALENPSAQ